MSQSNIKDGLKLLARPGISRMFVAYLISYAGTAMAPIAVAFGVLELTGSVSDSAIVIAAPTLASIVILLVGGVVADRTSRQRVMVFAEVLAMLAQFVIAYLFLSGYATVPLLTLFMLVNGIAMAFNAPAATGFIVQLVDEHELQAANALLGIARNGAIAAGAALGGILVAAFGAGLTLIVDAVSFGLSALLILTIVPRSQVKPAAASVIDDLRSGWREFTSHTWLWTIVLQFSFIVAAEQSVFGLLGPAVTLAFMDGAVDWGYIAAGFGAGTLLGGIIGLSIRPRYPMRFATWCVFFFSGVSLSLAVPLPVYMVVLAAFVSGATGQVFAVIWYTTIQKRVPWHMLSRVSAYDHLGSIVLAPLGIVVSGLLFDSIGFRAILVIASLFVILPTIAVFAVRDVRMMTADPD